MSLIGKLKRMISGDSGAGDGTFACPKCDKAFDTAKAKMEHAKEAHATAEESSEGSSGEAQETEDAA